MLFSRWDLTVYVDNANNQQEGNEDNTDDVEDAKGDTNTAAASGKKWCKTKENNDAVLDVVAHLEEEHGMNVIGNLTQPAYCRNEKRYASSNGQTGN